MRHMKIYRALEERGLALSFHSAINPGEPVFKSLNRFASVHALGFPFYNILHLTNWVTNGLCERFPKLPVIWIEGGLAWIPFLMQRLDHEYMLRSSEYPLLKKKPSEYMRDMYYASQPMEAENMRALACTFEMIGAETQLLYASDYPHWDFDLPSRIWDLPFLSPEGQAQHSRRHRVPPVQAAAAHRRTEGQPRALRQRRGVSARKSPLLGVLPLPIGGEAWGRGLPAKSREHNPSPHPSPYGRGSRPSCGAFSRTNSRRGVCGSPPCCSCRLHLSRWRRTTLKISTAAGRST